MQSCEYCMYILNIKGKNGISGNDRSMVTPIEGIKSCKFKLSIMSHVGMSSRL